ncbi:uncharacterized protein DS421_5g151040 [Arachis hypogaea]|nr:uncharacterized protein DS421_5g151040 [Arachis hypogaea]
MPGSQSHLGMPLERPSVARQCTKRPKQGLAVPLGIEGVARQSKNLTMVCHLSAGRGIPATGTKGKIMGVARQPLGVARWYKFPERMGEAKHMGVPHGVEGVARHPLFLIWACHLNPRRGTPVSFKKQKPLGRAT